MAPNKDDELLMNLGYKPELKRNFSPIETFGIAFSIMSPAPGIATIFGLGLMAGGVGLTWGWLVPGLFTFTVGMALSELGSSMPTSGGLYWWTYKFAPQKYKRVLCWLCGYTNTLGLIGTICSINHGFSTMLLTIPALATDGRYEPTKFVNYGVYAACIITQVFVSFWSTKIVARLQAFCIFINFFLIVLLVIALPVGLKHKGGEINSGSFVYGSTQNLYTGWPYGWAWFLAWMGCIWCISAFDSAIHMSEEASNAATAVPLGILLSISLAVILGFLTNSVLAAVMDPNSQNLLDSFTGSPFTQIIYDCLNKKWAIAIQVILMVLQWIVGLSILVVASRQTWSFSRDGALPLSSVIRKLNFKNIPFNALFFDAVLALLLGLLIIINDTAANALFSLAASSIMLAWMLPIITRAFFCKEGDFVPGPFYLGHTLSRINSFVASAYLIFVTFVVTMMPEVTPVDSKSMNYTCVINAAVWILSLLYYFVDGHKWFTGPKLTLDVDTMEGQAGGIENALVRMPSKEVEASEQPTNEPSIADSGNSILVEKAASEAQSG